MPAEISQPESQISSPEPAPMAGADDHFPEVLSFYFVRFLLITMGIGVGLVVAYVAGVFLGWIDLFFC
jgi:hypothetical protein